MYSYLKCIVYDKLLKPRQSFRITLYIYDNTLYIYDNLPHVAVSIGNTILQVADMLNCEETETPGKRILIYCDSFLSFSSVCRFPQ